MSQTLPHLRADARENRDRVLEAARELFAESGLAVTMRQIARRAQVGPATLYRRFQTKQDLVLAAFLDEMRICRGIVEQAKADPDPWRGVRTVVEQIIEHNARNQGFTEAFMASYPAAVDFVAHRSVMLADLAVLTKRAKQAGDLRPDFVLDDFLLVLASARGLTTIPVERRPAAARRYAALALDGFRADAGNATLPPPVGIGSEITRTPSPQARASTVG